MRLSLKRALLSLCSSPYLSLMDLRKEESMKTLAAIGMALMAAIAFFVWLADMANRVERIRGGKDNNG